MRKVLVSLLTLFLIVSLAAPSVGAAGAPDAVHWLRFQQQPDGGFLGFGGSSDAGMTSDVALAFAAAGVDPHLVATNGHSIVDFLTTAASAYGARAAGAAKLIVAAVASGADPRHFGGVDLVARLQSKYDPNTGLYDAQQLYVDAYALLALRAAGVDVPAKAIDALEQSQAQNGGWAWNGSTDQSQADSNTTSIVVQALIAAGETRNAATINKALGYLRAAQLDDGSFVYQIGAEPSPVGDANSTALAVQALLAAGQDPASDDWKHATAALAHFQNASGAFRYRDDDPQDNLLATAQAVPALESKPLPIQPGPGFGQGGPLQLAMQPARPKTGCDYFTKTEHNVCAGFRAYWQQFGGLPNFGYPLTEEFVDPATGLTVQYFERARFEWHPGAWPARYDVLLGRLGAELTRQRAATDPAFQPQAASANPACVYVAVTRHNLCAGFRAYWERFGGLPVFGYPISDAFLQDGMVVQYFERARFEWHPGAWPERYDVLLGRLGAEEIGLR